MWIEEKVLLDVHTRVVLGDRKLFILMELPKPKNNLSEFQTHEIMGN